ncbi:helix-turn-helix transcriptional regulator [Enterobacteriaceae bacterium H20N1]|uniref:Helix-turn-helix transcriptional regulator n=1 Tax=Dryocola boscaweniae TaxID=2925397 RepID=A0A9X2W835_9ENTR|nr:helix-turn-helix transcriptional regulator [Dryocola boscaweniae]MCT4702555.1 helix-turn-helix transcriptional regulator [Dryocola boscaweniae]MCT4716407.1 helix-turn-helix transcriptional regulator [Dryocola boscaweniae]MCT4719723.1 helix-turn-helix transcriptional regulator [Dryocola boscaweniae]
MKGYTSLEELIARRSPESQKRIAQGTQELILETCLHLIREEMGWSQKQLAEAMGISQPAITAIEQRGNEIKLGTLKRYIEALGGTLSLQIEFPEGVKHVEVI